ncbi:hypothetical protein [Pseudarthrobacter cellobiosi]|uniref:hypothetical protein n=1 Tax=Pseudarthrobacter cellobiosi TaxID=2953654 RepID=UPI00208EBA22|nr:hypothetical protein [Pseudarthrobacter sp. HLT1-5]MCO4257357.1 hypothetical protein [Pseudarthrobacter sp. HLT1-5]
MSTSLDLDISALVGEMDAVPCEHTQHGLHPLHTDSPASHYVRVHCPSCPYDSGVFAACQGFIAAVLANMTGRCFGCDTTTPASEAVTILGPVGGSK